MANLKRLRLAKGFSQQTLADAIGVHRTVIANWESGKYKPTEEHCLALGRLLEVSEQKLMKQFDLAVKESPSAVKRKIHRYQVKIQQYQEKLQQCQEQLKELASSC